MRLVTTLLRGLPEELRRPLVPVPGRRQRCWQGCGRGGGLLEDMAEQPAAARRAGAVAAFDLARLPPHRRVTFRIEDESRGVLAQGKDLARVREAVRPRLRAELTATGSLERRGERSWTLGTLPRTVTLPGTGAAVTAYPALVDEGETVGVRTFETGRPGAGDAGRRAGCCSS